jgi:hypothetical protein
MAVIFPAEHLLGTAATLGVLQCTAVLLAPLHAALAANALQLLQRQWQGQEQSAEANGVGGVALDYIEQARCLLQLARSAYYIHHDGYTCANYHPHSTPRYTNTHGSCSLPLGAFQLAQCLLGRGATLARAARRAADRAAPGNPNPNTKPNPKLTPTPTPDPDPDPDPDPKPEPEPEPEPALAP